MTPARTADEATLIEHLMMGGWGKDFRTAPEAARRSAEETLERWMREGLPFARLPDGRHAFDPAEVMNFAKSAGVEGRDDFWAARYVHTGRALIQELGTSPAKLEPRRIAIRLERAFNLEHVVPGTPARLRVPFPAEVPTMREVRSTLLPAGARVRPGFVEIVTAVTEDEPLVSVAYEFVAQPSVESEISTLDANEAEMYLQAGSSSRISALATELAAGARTPLDAVRAFWNFFFERLMLGVLHDRQTPDDVLESGWFDCRLGSELLVALCRARGIPARSCSGFTLYSVPFYHFWAEVWVDRRGWFPIDLTCWDLSLRGTDPEWRDYFFGALDYRMTVEVLPQTFTGFPSLHLPHRWYALSRPLENGAAFAVYASDTGKRVYEDRVVASVKAGPLLP